MLVTSSPEAFIKGYSENPLPNKNAVETLSHPGTLFISGRFVGAGKDTLIHGLGKAGFLNVPTWITRDLRPGEVEGVHKKHVTREDIVLACISGDVLEVEQLSSGHYYATVATEFNTPERQKAEGVVKDIEWKGIRSLRRINPELKVVVPLASLEKNALTKVTAWEERLANRHGWRRSISSVEINDLKERLEAVVEAVDMLYEDDAMHDPNVLIIINDNVPSMLHKALQFAKHGTRPAEEQHTRPHLEQIREIANVAVLAACH